MATTASAGEKPAKEVTGQGLVKALSHPTRVKILGVLSHRTISPAEYAKESGELVSNVSYHFRELAKYGFAEIVGTRPVRGSTEHFYCGTRRAQFGDDVWETMPKPLQRAITGTVLEGLVGRMVEALAAGTFDARDDSHFTWTPMVVDEEGWGELMGILGSAFAEIAEVEVKAAERMAREGGETITTTVALAGFESPKGQSK